MKTKSILMEISAEEVFDVIKDEYEVYAYDTKTKSVKEVSNCTCGEIAGIIKNCTERFRYFKVQF